MKKHEAAPTPASAPAPARPVTLSADEHRRLTEQARQAQQHLDQYQRLLADFDNAKKRLERERAEAVRFGAERVLRDLLPIVDSFDHALKSLSSAIAQDPMLVGVKLIHRQLHELLGREGVQPIESVGQPFDPHKHEAAAEVPVADGQADHAVVEEIQKGYTMHGKILRSAMVKVAVHRLEQTGTVDSPERSTTIPHAEGETNRYDG